MKTLSQEVLSNIAGFLPQRHGEKQVRPAIATVSRTWQHAIEPFTFAFLRITSHDLDAFESAFARSRAR
ncbi:uncharacterized protein PG986_006222 [Apiospora aurea]|uniref:F-box domain-containing protein n=1 Tax=Apiospora aurea TaxID=335848 RepID=A0ABR1QJU9_9PEZI